MHWIVIFLRWLTGWLWGGRAASDPRRSPLPEGSFDSRAWAALGSVGRWYFGWMTGLVVMEGSGGPRGRHALGPPWTTTACRDRAWDDTPLPRVSFPAARPLKRAAGRVPRDRLG